MTSACGRCNSPRCMVTIRPCLSTKAVKGRPERLHPEGAGRIEPVLLADQHRVIDRRLFQVASGRPRENRSRFRSARSPGARRRVASWFSIGISRRQGAHQVAQKLMTCGRPFHSERLRGLPSRSASVTSGRRSGMTAACTAGIAGFSTAAALAQTRRGSRSRRRRRRRAPGARRGPSGRRASFQHSRAKRARCERKASAFTKPTRRNGRHSPPCAPKNAVVGGP